MKKRIFFFFKAVRLPLLAALVCAAFAGGLQLTLPYLMGQSIDYIHGAGKVDFKMLAHYTLLMAAAVLGCALFHWLTKQLSNKVAFGIGKAIRADLMKKADALPISFYDKAAQGDLLSRVSGDVETITEGIQNTTSQLFTGIFTLLGTLVLMLSLNWVITLIVVR